MIIFCWILLRWDNDMLLKIYFCLVFGSHLRVKLGGYIFVPGGDAVCVSPVVTVGATARSEG